MPTLGYVGKWAFLHVPKTGSTWAAEVLEASWHGYRAPYWTSALAHMPSVRGAVVSEPSTIRRRCDTGDRFLFAFVRDPRTWYGSVWSHMSLRNGWMTGGTGLADLFSELRIRAPHYEYVPTFDEWVEWMCEHRPGFVSRLYEQFCGTVDAEIEFVGRMENLVADLHQALALAGDPLPSWAEIIGPRNVIGSSPTWRGYWRRCRGAMRLIEESERDAIERFGY